MSRPLTIVAVFQANAGREAQLAAALGSLVAPTRAESGCLNYDLHRDLDVPGRFLFHENWATRVDWEAHMVSDHLKHHQATSVPLVASVEIFQMEMTGD
jgi:quinol monooxygenase YgiN